MLPDLAVSARASEQASGTDGESLRAYKPAYKKLAKNAYSGSDRPSTIDTNKLVDREPNNGSDLSDNSMQDGQLGNNCHSVTTKQTERPGFEPGVQVLSRTTV